MHTPKEIVARALADNDNKPGTCQLWTRTIIGAPSVGDVDKDGDADAVDGWKSEPESKRHTDRNPPAGMPVAWGGGTHGYGHRAISLGNGKIRSTDAGGSGKVATVDLDFPEKQWGLKYLGWSETMSGYKIPEDPKPTTPPRPVRPAPEDKTPDRLTKVERSRKLLERALEGAENKGNAERAKDLREALDKLEDL